MTVLYLSFFLLIIAVVGCGPDPDRNEAVPAVEEPERNEAVPTVEEPDRVNLINESYFRPFDLDSVESGVVGRLSDDFDGDGEEEDLIVYESTEVDERGEPARDDGQVWYVYIEEKSGKKTYLFADWVQLGRLDVMQAPADSLGLRPLLLWKVQGSGVEMFKVRYAGPDSTEAVALLSHLYDRVVPMEPWRKKR